jgi:hypothetical protein
MVVRVQPTCFYPLNIPFWKNSTVAVSATSQMMINE